MTNNLILIRGLPGSGKTTFAAKFIAQGFILREADQYFTDENGIYNYRIADTGFAHEYCRTSTLADLIAGNDVVVANTFTQLWELKPYLNMDFPTKVYVTQGNWLNIHNVPAHILMKMRDRWEVYEGETFI